MLRLKRIKISRNVTVRKAPTGSINAKTPLMVPIELPIRNPVSRLIKNNEYLRHGLILQNSNFSKAWSKLRYKIVDWNLFDIEYQKYTDNLMSYVKLVNDKHIIYRFLMQIKEYSQSSDEIGSLLTRQLIRKKEF